MTNHTPTPWVAEDKGGKGSWIMGANKEWSALSCGNSHETADANAAFIVKAVNSHDTLVKALVIAKRQLTLLGGDHRPYPDVENSDKIQGAVLNQIDDALALCKKSDKTGAA